MAFYVDNVKVGGIEDLCKRLKIDSKKVPFRRINKEFEQNMIRDASGNPKRDRDGNYEVKRKIAGSPVFTVYVEGEAEVQVRWATTQRKDKDDNFVYSPTLITMDPAEDGTVAFNDDNMFVYWYLHPWNRQSPFHTKGSLFYYDYKDADARSKFENDIEEVRIDAMSFIVGRNALSISKLRVIAKGLNMTGVDDMTNEVVRKKLRDYASADPHKFVNIVESREVAFSGKIQEAIDRGVLELRTLNGMSRWYLKEDEILPVGYGQDAQAVLKDELSTKWYQYSDAIENALNNTEWAANLNNPVNDAAFEKVEDENRYTKEQLGLLARINTDELYAKRIKELSALDITKPGIHHATVKSYNDNLPAIEAYRLSLLEEQPV